MLKVMIVDDMNLLRDSFKMVLEKDKNISVVGLAQNGIEAFRLYTELIPDVVLMDLNMPVYSGFEAIKDIKTFNNRSKILVLTVDEDEQSMYNAFRNGADGYILKNIKAADLLDVIKKTYLGEEFVKENAFCCKTPYGQITEKKEKSSDLTSREQEVFDLISLGLTNEQIAENLHISTGRTKNIVAELISKFMVQNRTQLAIVSIKSKMYETI